MSGFYTPPNVRGEDKQIQYNENGVLSASSDLIWDDTEKELYVTGDAIISGFTTTQTLSVSGVSTFVGVGTFQSDLYVGGDLYVQDDIVFDSLTAREINVTEASNLENLYVSGVSTFASNVDINASVDVDGHTELDDLNVSGVSTFSSSVNLDGDLNISDVGIGTTFTTSLQIQTPTADRVVTIPDATGTLALISGNTGYVPYNDNGSNSSDSGFTFNSNTGLAVTTNVRAGVDTSRGIILTSPNGTEYLLFVDNSGVLGTTTSIV